MDTTLGDIPPIHPYIGAVLGAVLGLALAVLVVTAGLVSGKKMPAAGKLVKRTWLPLVTALASLGAWIGFVLTKPDDSPDWYPEVMHGLLILTLAFSGWLWYSALGLMSDPTILTNVATGRDARRYWTQAQVLEKAFRAIVVSLTVIFIILTFPQARAPMASLLASAGLLSVIAGLAAQTSLGNMFAGLQLAFTDAIRVGDTIKLEQEEQPGQVEEITLTYVVLRIWDGRRIILPSTEFTTKPFENWTRESVSQMALTSIQVDWKAPVAEIRAQVEKLVTASPLWDKKSWSVQVSDLQGPYMTLRVVVSAENWAKAWDLRANVRENLVAWINENAPWSIPRDRVLADPEQVDQVQISTEQVVPHDLAPPQFTGPAGGGTVDKARLMQADPDAELRHEKQQIAAVDEGRVSPGAADAADDGSLLFNGTPEKSASGSIYNGPGKTILGQRRWRRRMRREQEQSLPVTEPPRGKK